MADENKLEQSVKKEGMVIQILKHLTIPGYTTKSWIKGGVYDTNPGIYRLDEGRGLICNMAIAVDIGKFIGYAYIAHEIFVKTS